MCVRMQGWVGGGGVTMADSPLSCCSGYLIIPEKRRWAGEEGGERERERCKTGEDATEEEREQSVSGK